MRKRVHSEPLSFHSIRSLEKGPSTYELLISRSDKCGKRNVRCQDSPGKNWFNSKMTLTKFDHESKIILRNAKSINVEKNDKWQMTVSKVKISKKRIKNHNVEGKIQDDKIVDQKNLERKLYTLNSHGRHMGAKV